MECAVSVVVAPVAVASSFGKMDAKKEVEGGCEKHFQRIITAAATERSG